MCAVEIALLDVTKTSSGRTAVVKRRLIFPCGVILACFSPSRFNLYFIFISIYNLFTAKETDSGSGLYILVYQHKPHCCNKGQRKCDPLKVILSFSVLFSELSILLLVS